MDPSHGLLPTCSVPVPCTSICCWYAALEWRAEGIFQCSADSLPAVPLSASRSCPPPYVSVVGVREATRFFLRYCWPQHQRGGRGAGAWTTRVIEIYPIGLPRCEGRAQGQVEGSHRVKGRTEAAGNLWVREGDSSCLWCRALFTLSPLLCCCKVCSDQLLACGDAPPRPEARMLRPNTITTQYVVS